MRRRRRRLFNSPYKRKVIGFYSKGRGKNRKVIPITARSNHPRIKYKIINIPKAPRKIDYSKMKKGDFIKVTQVDVKRLEQNDIAVYVDGEGNIISYDIKGEKDDWWNVPNLGTTKLRSEEIYTKKSMKHPARMNPLWAQRMIQEYSKPNDVILDPMAGIGTTGIEASRLGRKAILIDKQKIWVNEMKKNVQRLKKSGQMKGSIKVLHGDATKLQLKNKVDAIMFSPPYLFEGTHFTDYGSSRYHTIAYQDLKHGAMADYKYGDYEKLMSEVYASCYKNLKKGGYMVVNGKDKITNGKITRIDPITIRLAEKQGFKLVAKHNVYAQPTVSRLAAEKNYGIPHIRHETFLVFKKP